MTPEQIYWVGIVDDLSLLSGAFGTVCVGVIAGIIMYIDHFNIKNNKLLIFCAVIFATFAVLFFIATAFIPDSSTLQNMYTSLDQQKVLTK